MKHVPNTHKLTTEQIHLILTDALNDAFHIQVQKFSPNRESVTDGIIFAIQQIHAERYRKFTIIFREGRNDQFSHDYWEFCYSSMDYYVVIRCGILEGELIMNSHGLKPVEQ